MQHLSHPRNLKGLVEIFSPILPEHVSLDVHAGSAILRMQDQVVYTKRIMSILSNIPGFTIVDYNRILSELCNELIVVITRFQQGWPSLDGKQATLETNLHTTAIDVVLSNDSRSTILGTVDF